MVKFVFISSRSQKLIIMTQITYEQRYAISMLLNEGKSQTEIAVMIGKHKSSTSRELKRNSDLRSGKYRLDLAEKKCRERPPLAQVFSEASLVRLKPILFPRWRTIASCA